MAVYLTETLTCNKCGIDWTRKATRERKPAVCPDCKALAFAKAQEKRKAKAEPLPTCHYCAGPAPMAIASKEGVTNVCYGDEARYWADRAALANS